jgi:hypothetical protein
MHLAVVSAVESPIALTRRVSIVPRFGAQWVPRHLLRVGDTVPIGDKVSDVFNRLTLNPGVGVEIRF